MNLQQLPTTQDMCHADEQLWCHATVSSDAYIDVPFFKHFTGKKEITLFSQFSIQDKMSTKIHCEFREKGDFLGEVNKFCVGLHACPLMSLSCILIGFTYSLYGPDTKIESNHIAPFKSTLLYSFTSLRCSTNCFQEIRLILCIISSLNEWDCSTLLWKATSIFSC